MGERRVTPTGVLVSRSGDLTREAWLEARKSGIGGSDIGALLGMSRYTSPYELYLDKRGELPDRRHSEALERSIRWGHLHEPLIAAEFCRQHDVRTRRIGLIRHASYSWRLANLDRQVTGCPDGPCGLEIKNRSAWKAAEWGDSGDPDGVPDTEALQTHWYIGVTGYSHFHVGVLINGNDDRYYRVERDEQLMADVTALAETFWKRVQSGDPPPLDGSAAVTELLADLWAAQENLSVAVDSPRAASLLAAREELKAEAAATALRIDEVENLLKAMLGDGEIALADGPCSFTWRRNGQFLAGKFAEAHPDLAAKYQRPVSQLDRGALRADHPDLYRAFRARVFRVTTSRKDDAA